MFNKIKHLVGYLKNAKELVEVFEEGIIYKRAWETIYGYDKYKYEKYYNDVLPYEQREAELREVICKHLDEGKLVSRKYRLKAKQMLTETRDSVNFMLRQKGLMEQGLL